MPQRYTPRLATFNYVGSYRYSLTWCTYERRPVFHSMARVTDVLSQILRSAGRHDIAVLAYCFMPDHLHLLVAGQEETSETLRFINLAKQLSGHRYRQATGHRLWQRSSWDRVLRADDDTTTVMRYLLLNPVRAGLVDEPLNYPGSGSLVFERAELLDVFRDWMPG